MAEREVKDNEPIYRVFGKSKHMQVLMQILECGTLDGIRISKIAKKSNVCFHSAQETFERLESIGLLKKEHYGLGKRFFYSFNVRSDYLPLLKNLVDSLRRKA